MTQVSSIVSFLDSFAPAHLAESWDNVGLLLGEDRKSIRTILTCLTLTMDVADEAISKKCGLIVTHHPIMFRPLQKITSETPEGRLLLKLMQAGISVFSPHTRYDSAPQGINQQLAEMLGLREIQPIRLLGGDPPEVEAYEKYPEEIVSVIPDGSGRWGRYAKPILLKTFLNRVKKAFGISHLQYVGTLDQKIEKAGIACGAAVEYLSDVHRLGCQAFLTGEARFHSCLEARELQIAMILPGHYVTERFAMESLASRLQEEFPKVVVSASEVETDPLQTI